MWRTFVPVPPVYASRGPRGEVRRKSSREGSRNKEKRAGNDWSSLAVASDFSLLEFTLQAFEAGCGPASTVESSAPRLLRSRIQDLVEQDVVGRDAPGHRLSHDLLFGLSGAGDLVQLLNRRRKLLDQLETVARPAKGAGPASRNSVRLGSSPRARERVGGLRAFGRCSDSRASATTLLRSDRLRGYPKSDPARLAASSSSTRLTDSREQLELQVPVVVDCSGVPE
jgi:hypothetical protein